jgi:hypothetical protein
LSGKGWSDSDKVKAVTTYLAVGKLPLVEVVTGVPRSTLKQWRLQPWWKELEEEIRREDEYELDAKLSKLIDKSLDAVAERIENGEFRISKTGQIQRVPVTLKDVHRVAVDLVDKRNLIRGKPTSRVEKTETVDTLQKLAAQFAEWVKISMKPEPKVIEGEVLAVHEERETGLQDRVQQVPQPENSKEESRSA